MDPTEAIAADKPRGALEVSAPAAAQWLSNPSGPEPAKSLAEKLASEPEWEGPDQPEEDEAA